MRPQTRPLEQLIRQRQIVQEYPPAPATSLPFPTTPQPTRPRFFEDEIFEELDRTAIVEKFFNDDDYDLPPPEPMQAEEPERMEEQPYEQLFSNIDQRFPQPVNRKMLDSSSSDRELPPRDSSISSMSSVELPPSPLGLRPQASQLDAPPPLKIHEEKPPAAVPRARRQVDSSVEKREKMARIKKLQQVGCNCRKTRCLKMYCQCFNLQILCNENCNCVDCGNNHQNQSHKKAVLDALTRNPKAFTEDSQKLPPVFGLGVELKTVRRGCKCRKTKCLKKYCECYGSGQPCGIFCQCEGCENPFKQEQSP